MERGLSDVLGGAVPRVPSHEVRRGARLHGEYAGVCHATLADGTRVVEKRCRRVRNEARALRRLLRVPGVVRLVGYVEESSALLLRFRDEQDLIEALPALHDLPARRSASLAVRIAEQVLATLERVHAVGIAHLDVKLENVLIDPAVLWGAPLRATLIDFELSRERWPPSAPAPPHTSGSLVCMPPETLEANALRAARSRARTGPVSRPACDAWCAGSLLFQLCFGTYPFGTPEGEAPHQLIEYAGRKAGGELDAEAVRLARRRVAAVPELTEVLRVWSALCAADPAARLSCGEAHRRLQRIAERLDRRG